MDTFLAFFLGFLHPAALQPTAVPLPPLRPVVDAPSLVGPPSALSCAFHETAEAGRRVIVARVSGPAAARGTFVFTLHQRDAYRNTINASQDGDYAVPVGGGSVDVANTRTEAAQGDKIELRLDLIDAKGQIATGCSA